MRRLVYLCFAAPLLGCGTDPGAIEIRWTIGATNDCDEAGISQVRITLHDEDGAIQGPFLATCTAGARAPFTLNDVDEGSYTITLEGLDDGSPPKVIFTGESSARYNVTAGKTTTTDAVQLNPAPPSIRVRWNFANDLLCGPNGVVTVQAKAFFLNTALATGETVCNNGEIVLQESTLVPGAYDVQVNGLDSSDHVTFRSTQTEVEVSPGEETILTVSLQDCTEIAGGCP